MIAEEMTWVVEMGAPKCVAAKMTIAPEVSAAKPWTGMSPMIFRPTVLMIRQPPPAVPRAMDVAQAITTQSGMWKECRTPPETRAMVITPMDFWASFPPWVRAMAEAEKIWMIRNHLFNGPVRSV